MQATEGPPLQLLAGGNHQSFNQTPFYIAGGGMSLNPTVNITVPFPNPLTAMEPRLSENPRDQISPKSTNGTRIGRWLKGQVSLRKTKSTPSSSPGKIVCPDGITVSPVQDLDVESSVSLTKPEIYIRSMLTSGKGLATWEPNPYDGQRSTVPGDVGTFSAVGGFKKIFNLWEDEESIRRTTFSESGACYTPPKRNVFTRKEALLPNEPIMDGTSADARYADDGNVSSFEFKMAAPRGAVLVSTSPADLEELDNYIKLRGFIVENARLLYQYGNMVRELDDDEALYIVTGCIKSDSWAMAAFKDPMPPPHDVLRLVKGGGGSDPLPTYMWTSRGTASAKSGLNTTRYTSNYQGKNQTLFMHGFKLSFSSAFRSRVTTPSTSGGMDSSGPPSDSGHSDDSNSKRQERHGENRGSSNEPNGGGGAGFSLNGANSSNGKSPCDDLSIETFPETLGKPATLHPLDLINRRLLYLTNAEFALTHDDDWRFALKNKSWEDVAAFDALQENKTFLRDGVAFLVEDEFSAWKRTYVPRIGRFDRGVQQQVADVSTDMTTFANRIRPSPPSQSLGYAPPFKPSEPSATHTFTATSTKRPREEEAADRARASTESVAPDTSVEGPTPPKKLRTDSKLCDAGESPSPSASFALPEDRSSESKELYSNGFDHERTLYRNASEIPHRRMEDGVDTPELVSSQASPNFSPSLFSPESSTFSSPSTTLFTSSAFSSPYPGAGTLSPESTTKRTESNASLQKTWLGWEGERESATDPFSSLLFSDPR